MWPGMFQAKPSSGNKLRIATKSTMVVFNRFIGGLQFTLIHFLLIVFVDAANPVEVKVSLAAWQPKKALRPKKQNRGVV
jgi:hypothetical protein